MTEISLPAQLMVSAFQSVTSVAVPRGLSRLAWISRRLMFGRGRKVVSFRKRFKITCDADSHFEIMNCCGFANREIDRVLGEILEPGGVFIDVGANVGTITLLASSCHGRKDVSAHCFEPDPKVFEILARNVSLNDFDIKVNNCAVGSSDGEAEFTISAVPGWSTLAPEPEGGFAFIVKEATKLVKVVTLDSYCRELAICPSAIKIDVEGLENEVLIGARGVIAESCPCLIVEINPLRLEAANSSAAQLFGTLFDFGYKLFHLQARRNELAAGRDRSQWGRYPEAWLEDIQPDDCRDVLAVHSKKLPV